MKNLILALSAILVFSASLCLASETLTVKPETIGYDPSDHSISSSGTMDISSLPQGVYTIFCQVKKSATVDTMLKISSTGVVSFGPITLNGQEMKSARSPLDSGFLYQTTISTGGSNEMGLAIHNVNPKDDSLYFQNIIAVNAQTGDEPQTLTINKCNAIQNKN